MRFDLLTLLWATAVLAVGVGAFGGWGIAAFGCTIYFWIFLFATRQQASYNPSGDTLLYVLLMGFVFMSTAAVVETFRVLSDGPAQWSAWLLMPLAFVALSLAPLPRYRRAVADLTSRQAR
ncbi:hypothetical protein Pla123a_08370 [Posidoniimonas polymericola]|uniref:Uncharacterized protein n=1 Tax=Posidoniimonas polymericola TaxID=2528002 RepID=A0A5C5YSY3_9BACT|nr:hypothetical protein [Posidoniimonas polymericola]TWT78048.1 hypothetical protein Pla123a_08370 [Posidoniimonas polymericola]